MGHCYVHFAFLFTLMVMATNYKMPDVTEQRVTFESARDERGQGRGVEGGGRGGGLVAVVFRYSPLFVVWRRVSSEVSMGAATQQTSTAIPATAHSLPIQTTNMPTLTSIAILCIIYNIIQYLY